MLLARRQMRDFGAMVSIELDGGFVESGRFAESLELFSIAASVGSTESLVMPAQLLHSSGYTPEQRASLSGGQRHGAPVDRAGGCGRSYCRSLPSLGTGILLRP